MGIYLVLGIVGLAGLCIWLAIHYAKRSEKTAERARTLTAARELQAEAEARLAERRHGLALLARLRRKRGGGQTPPASPPG